MSEQNHTPGPWQYHENKIPVSGKRNEVRNKDGLLICYVNIGMSDFVANAELIARAPELLQQVKQLEAERSKLKNIAKIIKTIVDTPEFKNIWPGTSESLNASLKFIREI